MKGSGRSFVTCDTLTATECLARAGLLKSGEASGAGAPCGDCRECVCCRQHLVGQWGMAFSVLLAAGVFVGTNMGLVWPVLDAPSTELATTASKLFNWSYVLNTVVSNMLQLTRVARSRTRTRGCTDCTICTREVG